MRTRVHTHTQTLPIRNIHRKTHITSKRECLILLNALCGSVDTEPQPAGFLQSPESSRAPLSVAPPGLHTHLPFVKPWASLRAGKTPRRLPFTSKSGHAPPGWSSETAPRGVRHYLTSVDTGPTAYRDVHRSSWRMWRSAHMHIYEYINIYIFFLFFVCEHLLWRKTLADTCRHRHTHPSPPSPLSLGLKKNKPLKTGGPTTPGQIRRLQGRYPLHSG